MKKIAFVKYLYSLCIFFLFACNQDANQEKEASLWEYHPTHFQANWDQQAFPLLQSFQHVQQTIGLADSVMVRHETQIILSQIDTLLVSASATDSNYQKYFIAALQTYRNEMEALNLESDPLLIKEQFNMCTLSLLQFLGNIGYQKTNIYIFEIQTGEKDWFWIGDAKITRSPYYVDQSKQYTASFNLSSK